jgi:hypothetical protein
MSEVHRSESKRALLLSLEALREDVAHDRVAYLHMLVSYTEEGGKVRNMNWHHEGHVMDMSEEELLRDLALLRISYLAAEEQLRSAHERRYMAEPRGPLSAVVEDE